MVSKYLGDPRKTTAVAVLLLFYKSYRESAIYWFIKSKWGWMSQPANGSVGIVLAKKGLILVFTTNRTTNVDNIL